jgi:hypothetical protein
MLFILAKLYGQSPIYEIADWVQQQHDLIGALRSDYKRLLHPLHLSAGIGRLGGRGWRDDWGCDADPAQLITPIRGGGRWFYLEE